MEANTQCSGYLLQVDSPQIFFRCFNITFKVSGVLHVIFNVLALADRFLFLRVDMPKAGH